MSKITGLGMTITVQDSGGMARDISNDINTMTFNESRALIDVTGVDVDAMERLAALRDFETTINGTFNADADMSHDVFKDLDNQREIVVTFPGSVATLTVTVALESYNVNRANNGGLTWTATGRCAGGSVSWS